MDNKRVGGTQYIDYFYTHTQKHKQSIILFVRQQHKTREVRGKGRQKRLASFNSLSRLFQNKKKCFGSLAKLTRSSTLLFCSLKNNKKNWKKLSSYYHKIFILPVSRSRITTASSTVPYSSNLDLRVRSSVPQDRPPTNNLTDIINVKNFMKWWCNGAKNFIDQRN